jgi:hypothetical protein
MPWPQYAPNSTPSALARPIFGIQWPQRVLISRAYEQTWLH